MDRRERKLRARIALRDKTSILPTKHEALANLEGCRIAGTGLSGAKGSPKTSL